MKKRLEIIVTGIVQDVCYRINTQEKARQLSLTGFIKNQPDGSVYIVAEGEENNLKQLAPWCYTGVKSAKVEEINQNWQAPTEEFSNFSIKY